MEEEYVDVYYEGEICYKIAKSKLMMGWTASAESGCGKAGREQHSMHRQDCYLTYCIHEDCNSRY